MPNRDGTGPRGQGAGQGFGLGRGLVAGRRLMGRFFPGSSGGFCKCPKCGNEMSHSRAQPCNLIKCPKCGSMMDRK